jgi:hypothetical protein
VGAGSAGAPHSRLSFSSYGQRVDVQAWGQNVMTTGRGGPAVRADAFNHLDERRLYTRSFGGTSSATPIVAGAILSINGARHTCGLPASDPVDMRHALSSTGTPQHQPTNNNIGPLPNIRPALLALGGRLGPCLPILQVSPTTMQLSSARSRNNASREIRLSASTGSVDYSIATNELPGWLRVSPTTGRVDHSSGAFRIALSPNDTEARRLSIGRYKPKIKIENMTNGLVLANKNGVIDQDGNLTINEKDGLGTAVVDVTLNVQAPIHHLVKRHRAQRARLEWSTRANVVGRGPPRGRVRVLAMKKRGGIED